MPYTVDPDERAALDHFEQRIRDSLDYLDRLRLHTRYGWQLAQVFDLYHGSICHDMAALHGEFFPRDRQTSPAFWAELDELFDRALDVLDDLPVLGVEHDFDPQVRNMIAEV